MIVAFRVLFRIIFNVSGGSPGGSTGGGAGGGLNGSAVLLDLPALEIATGFGLPVSLFGQVTAASLLAGFTDGLRLAAIVLAIGMANIVANPRRLLSQLPSVLYEVASAVALALNLAPQLVQSIGRIRRAREIRGRSGRLSVVSGTIVPVLEDTMARSLALAASMDARGFGYSAATVGSRLAIRAASLLALLLLTLGSYLLLTGAGPVSQGLLLAGLLLLTVALWLGSKQSVRTRARTNRWQPVDFTLAGLALALLALSLNGVVS